MNQDCIDVDQIADIESAPEGHPLRKHVAECPRCQSLWLSYQSFVKADTTGAVHIDTARRELADVIRRQAGLGPGRPSVASVRKPPAWSMWLRPALITAMAAVLTVLAISLWRGGADEPVLRGGEDSVWVLQAPRVSEGSAVLEWQAVADADAYDVQIFDDELNEVYRSGPVTTTSVTIARSAMPSVGAGVTLTWRVHAMRAGDVLSTSPPSSVTIQ